MNEEFKSKLSNKKFDKLCKKIAKECFEFMKIKLQHEFDIISNGDSKILNTNTAINIIITSSSLLHGNMIMICNNLYKDVNSENINMDELMRCHDNIMQQFIKDKKDKLN